MNHALQRRFVFISTMFLCTTTCLDASGGEGETRADSTWVSAVDQTRVSRMGQWQETRFRYAMASHLWTNSDGAGLECRFRGTGIVMRLGNHAVPAYGVPNLGSIAVEIDGKSGQKLVPRATPREVVVARGLDRGEHVLRVEHRAEAGGTGCRVEGFYVLDSTTGDLQFIVNGEENAFLVDARAVLRQGDRIVRPNDCNAAAAIHALARSDGNAGRVRGVGPSRWIAVVADLECEIADSWRCGKAFNVYHDAVYTPAVTGVVGEARRLTRHQGYFVDGNRVVVSGICVAVTAVEGRIVVEEVTTGYLGGIVHAVNRQ